MEIEIYITKQKNRRNWRDREIVVTRQNRLFM